MLSDLVYEYIKIKKNIYTFGMVVMSNYDVCLVSYNNGNMTPNLIKIFNEYF